MGGEADGEIAACGSAGEGAVAAGGVELGEDNTGEVEAVAADGEAEHIGFVEIGGDDEVGGDFAGGEA